MRRGAFDMKRSGYATSLVVTIAVLLMYSPEQATAATQKDTITRYAKTGNDSIVLKVRRKFVIRGTITDEEGNCLPSVGIMVKGTRKGLVSDINGNYLFDHTTDSTITLVVSYAGFKNMESRIYPRFDTVIQNLVMLKIIMDDDGTPPMPRIKMRVVQEIKAVKPLTKHQLKKALRKQKKKKLSLQ